MCSVSARLHPALSPPRWETLWLTGQLQDTPTSRMLMEVHDFNRLLTENSRRSSLSHLKSFLPPPPPSLSTAWLKGCLLSVHPTTEGESPARQQVRYPSEDSPTKDPSPYFPSLPPTWLSLLHLPISSFSVQLLGVGEHQWLGGIFILKGTLRFIKLVLSIALSDWKCLKNSCFVVWFLCNFVW